MENQSKTLEWILSHTHEVRAYSEMAETEVVFDGNTSITPNNRDDLSCIDWGLYGSWFYEMVDRAWEIICMDSHTENDCFDGCQIDWETCDLEIKHFRFFDPVIFRICYDQLTRKLTFDGYSPAECWIRWLLINFRFLEINHSIFPDDSQNGTFWGLEVERAEKLRALLKSELSLFSYNEFYSKQAASNSEIARDINTITALLRGSDRAEFLDLVRSCKLLEDIDTSAEYLELIEAERQYEIARLRLIQKVAETPVNSKKKLKKPVGLFPETQFHLSFNDEGLDRILRKHIRSQGRPKSESEELLSFAALRKREMAEESAKHSLEAAYRYNFFSFSDEYRWNGRPLKLSPKGIPERLLAIRRRIHRFLRED